jgi:hypothetical protein
VGSNDINNVSQLCLRATEFSCQELRGHVYFAGGQNIKKKKKDCLISSNTTGTVTGYVKYAIITHEHATCIFKSGSRATTTNDTRLIKSCFGIAGCRTRRRTFCFHVFRYSVTRLDMNSSLLRFRWFSWFSRLLSLNHFYKLIINHQRKWKISDIYIYNIAFVNSERW